MMVGRGTQIVHDPFNGLPGCTRYMVSTKVCIFDTYEGYVAVITIVGPPNDGKYRDVTINGELAFFNSLPVTRG